MNLGEDVAGLRVVQVITDDDRRGAQVFGVDLEAGLRALGHRVTTVALAPSRSGGLDVDTLGPTRTHPCTVRALRDRFRSADVVIAHGSTTLPMCAMAGVGTGTPFVYRQISDSLFWADTRLRRARVRAGLRRAARVVALWSGSAHTLQQEFRVPASRVDVVPNGVPGDDFRPATDDERWAARRHLGIAASASVVGYVGALAPEKGVDVLVRAVRSCGDATLLIAGDGSERASLQRLAAPLGDRVVFLGPLGSVRPAYAAADVIALPSRAGDSMPAVVIEAGLMGLPTVSTPVGAIPEILRDGRTGLLVPSGEEASLGHVLRRLLDDPARRRALGVAARAHNQQRYTIAAVARQWSTTLHRATRPPELTAPPLPRLIGDSS